MQTNCSRGICSGLVTWRTRCTTDTLSEMRHIILTLLLLLIASAVVLLIGCHCLSTQLNCLTGLSHGIIGIVVILPVTCTVRMSVPLSLVFPCWHSLALGQRPSPMYYSSYHCLVGTLAALDGPWLLCLPLCLPIAYYPLTVHLLIIVLLSLLVTDLIRMTHVLYQPLCGLSYK